MTQENKDDGGGLGWIPGAIKALGEFLPYANSHPLGVMFLGLIIFWGTVATISILAIVKSPDPLQHLKRPETPEVKDRIEQYKDKDGGTVIDVK